MCYDNAARPPLPPGAPGAAHGEDHVLTAADGNRFNAYLARPEGAPRARMLIYPDIRGLHPFYKDLARCLAEQGVAAVAMDFYGRTAGLDPRADDFEWRPHVAEMRLATVLADARAALTALGGDQPTFVMGFCLGGSLTLYTATEALGLAGAIPFYSGMTRVLDEAKGTALAAARHAQIPVLGLYGGADAGIPVEQVQALDETLDQAGVPHDLVIYPGAPHGFFDRRASEFAEASADAWRRVLAFVAQHAA